MWRVDDIVLLNPTLTIQNVAAPEIRFTVSSQPGRLVEFLKSNLLEWSAVSEATNSGGLLDFSDAAKRVPYAFYRVRYK